DLSLSPPEDRSVPTSLSGMAELDPAELKVGTVLSQLKTKQLWGLIAAVFGILAGVAVFAFKAGQWFQQPW
ncbi:MAG: hypothetical protein ACREYE_22410, partial [Gammaproteobacteria bacterium]